MFERALNMPLHIVSLALLEMNKIDQAGYKETQENVNRHVFLVPGKAI